MDAYSLAEVRLVQRSATTGGVAALYVAGPATPANTIRTILAAGYQPSATETRIVQFQIGGAGYNIPITAPLSWVYTAGTGSYFPMLTEGTEIKLFPGEYIVVNREAATAGSTMQLLVRFVDADLPLYHYEEPQVVKRQANLRSQFLRRIGGGGSGGSMSGAPGRGPVAPRGGGGGAAPV